MPRENGGRYPYFFCLGRTRGTGCKQPYVSVDLIETAVERAYGDVRLPGDQVERVREKLGEALAGMREKLLHAYYAGAVPVDLLRSEQNRLSTETSQAERPVEVAEASFTDVEDTLGKALDLLADCHRAYLAAPGTCAASGIRRCSSSWSFTTSGSGRPRVAEPFATLANPELPAALDGKALTGRGASSGSGFE